MRIDRSGLQVASVLVEFIENQGLAGTGITPDAFWPGVAGIFARFAPENRALLAKRDDIQAKLDDWHAARRGQPLDASAYQAFLREIGYLVEEPAPFTIGTENVDDEIARLKTKVGDITMANELLYAKIEKLEAGRPLAGRRSRR